MISLSADAMGHILPHNVLRAGHHPLRIFEAGRFDHDVHELVSLGAWVATSVFSEP